jgi:hypothetical protein
MNEKSTRARWCQNSPTTWILKAALKDGGEVLATIEGGQHAAAGYTYRSGSRMGWRSTLYRAQRAAREALRERTDGR